MKPGISLTIGIWNPTFHGQGILDSVPAIRDLKHKIRNQQSVIQKPRFSSMHLILEECQPVSRRVSFKIGWASLIVGGKFTVFALFYFVFEGNFPSTSSMGLIFGGAI